MGDDGVERLINKDGRFVAYHDDGEQYYVNREGEEVVLVESDSDEEEWVEASLKDRKPFLDGDGNPIIMEKQPETKAEEPEATAEKAASKSAETEKPKKKRRTSKVDTNDG